MSSRPSSTPPRASRGVHRSAEGLLLRRSAAATRDAAAADRPASSTRRSSAARCRPPRPASSGARTTSSPTARRSTSPPRSASATARRSRWRPAPSTKTVGGETFPNKNFPDTDTTQAAFYIQDIAQWGPLRLIPAVRFDYFSLTPITDQFFANSNTPNFTIHEQEETAISPKLGATYDLTQQLSPVCAVCARLPGAALRQRQLRLPQHLVLLRDPAQRQPEARDQRRLRGAACAGSFQDGSSFQLTAFYNIYHDFIDTVTLKAPPPPGFTQFQYQNIGEVVIRGIEGKGEWRFLPEWALFGSFAYAGARTRRPACRSTRSIPSSGRRGHSLSQSQRTAGAARSAPATSREKDRVSQVTFFKPPSTSPVDALLSYEVVPTFTINARRLQHLQRELLQPAGRRAGADRQIPTSSCSARRAATCAMNATVRW